MARPLGASWESAPAVHTLLVLLPPRLKSPVAYWSPGCPGSGPTPHSCWSLRTALALALAVPPSPPLLLLLYPLFPGPSTPLPRPLSPGASTPLSRLWARGGEGVRLLPSLLRLPAGDAACASLCSDHSRHGTQPSQPGEPEPEDPAPGPPLPEGTTRFTQPTLSDMALSAIFSVSVSLVVEGTARRREGGHSNKRPQVLTVHSGAGKQVRGIE